jgi:multiple sugar transport system substrate-binding protein
MLEDKVSAYPPPAPRGSVEFDRNVMRRVADLVAFGQASIDEAAEQLVADGSATVSKT